MNRNYRLLIQTLLLVVFAAAAAPGAQVESVRLFSEQDYSRLSIGLDASFVSNVETNPAEKLIFVKFEGVGIDKLSKQSYVYDDSPFLESVSFLPLGGNQIVARIKARQDFRLKTYESAEPYRLILELSSREIKNPSPAASKDSYYQLGLEQMADGSYQAALMSFRSAIRSGERVADSYYQAGRTRLRLGELDNALINFGRATGSESFGCEASLYQSWIHFKQGDHDKMAANWREFVRRVPDAAGRFRIASASTEIDFRSLEDAVSQEPAKAGADKKVPAATVKTAVADSPDAAWYFEQGVAAKQEDRLDAAAQLLEKAAQLDPGDSETHFQLGVVYKGLGRKQASARQFQLSLGAGARTPAVKEAVLPQADPAAKQEAAPKNYDHLEPLIGLSAASAVSESQGESESANENEAVVAAGGLGGDAAGTPPAAVAGSAESDAMGTIRSAVVAMIQQYGVGLLRRQVGILTSLMGLIFLLTLAAERYFRHKRNRRESMFGPGLPALAAASASGGPSPQVIQNSSVQRTARKQQVAQVLAQELQSKRQASQPAVRELADDTMQLQLKPVGERGMYGADIARRIKEELSPSRAGTAPEAVSSLAGGRRDDMQTRLIRQLRSKNWTIGDIAQEMSLSREEIKWALAGNGSSNSNATGARPEVYGQVSALAARGGSRRTERIDPERINREVDLELEINV